MRRPRPRPLGDESGFTLVELLAAMSIGMIVLLGCFALLDRSVTASHEITQRQEALQRGSVGLENITRQLRSQVCLGTDVTPIVQGQANELTLYVDLSDGTRPAERRRLVYDPSAQTITQFREVGSGTVPNVTFAPPVQEILLTRVTAAPGEAVFRYYAFPASLPAPGASGVLTELTAPLSSTDAARVVKVGVGFVSLPEQASMPQRLGTTLHESVFVRSADTNKQQGGPRCL